MILLMVLIVVWFAFDSWLDHLERMARIKAGLSTEDDEDKEPRP